MRVHDSQAYRKIDVARERISRILEPREILLSFQTGFSLVNVANACAILESISGLEPSLVITEPRYLKLVTVYLPYIHLSIFFPVQGDNTRDDEPRHVLTKARPQGTSK